MGFNMNKDLKKFTEDELEEELILRRFNDRFSTAYSAADSICIDFRKMQYKSTGTVLGSFTLGKKEFTTAMKIIGFIKQSESLNE